MHNILSQVHQVLPELSEPEHGKVYDMEAILENIHGNNQTEARALQDNDVQVEEKLEQCRPLRKKQRIDYKQLHDSGRTVVKKKDSTQGEGKESHA